MKKFLQEFKEFALRGNVIDMAVGVVIGAAFSAIVDSLVSDIISPVIGLFAGQDFSSLVLTIFGVDIKYGSFITAIINFVLIALCLFIIIKAVNAAQKLGKHNEAETAPAPTEKECPYCMNKIPIAATRCGFCTSQLNE